MNFTIPFRSSQANVNAVVQRGVDAMFDIQAAGGVADVAFVFEEEEEEVEQGDNNNNNNNNNEDNNEDKNTIKSEQSDNNNDSTSMIITMKEWVGDVTGEQEFVPVCSACGEQPCLFLKHKESLVAYDEAEHDLLGDEGDAPTNNIRRKKLYRQLTLMLNGGPLGAGVRRELPSCCVSAIREMLPSETFMGFKTE